MKAKLLAIELDAGQEWLFETPCTMVVLDPWGNTVKFKGVVRQTEGAYVVEGDDPVAVNKFEENLRDLNKHFSN